jgi:hypothetical protein
MISRILKNIPLIGRWFRSRDARHSGSFRQYIDYAVRAIRSLGAEAIDRRDTDWHLIPGEPVVNFGRPDWAFLWRGRRVLGLCIWGDPIRIELGGDGKGNYNTKTAEHEAGHAIRFQSGDFGHHPRFRAVFEGWSDTGARMEPFGGEDLYLAAVDYYDGDAAIVGITGAEIAALENRTEESMA